MQITVCDKCEKPIAPTRDRWSRLTFTHRASATGTITASYIADVCDGCRTTVTLHEVIELILRRVEASDRRAV